MKNKLIKYSLSKNRLLITEIIQMNKKLAAEVYSSINTIYRAKVNDK